MRLIRGVRNLRAGDRGCVATIGNYDGLHRGHQAVLSRLFERAREMGQPSLMMTFEPTAAEYFSGDSPPARLTRLREKYQALKHFGLNKLFLVRFDRALAAMEASEFVEVFLVDGLAVSHLVIGDDFRFGRGRQGDLETLRAAGEDYGFAVERVSSFEVDGVRVSSTVIRDALARGDLEAATGYLGRPYRMSGRVIGGEKLGRQLGFATANVSPKRAVMPVQGVFAVRASGIAGAPCDGVASVGTRPTVAGREPLLEVHLFDFDQDIYHCNLDVDFIVRLRDEVKFPDVASMREQIKVDADRARRLLAGDQQRQT